MKARSLVTVLLCVAPAGVVHAGGLLLPGSGAVSTARAGASVASVSGGDSIAINPAGLASQPGTQITISGAFIDYDVTFSRYGYYEPAPDAPSPLPWEYQPYPAMSDDSSPPIGIGDFQLVPVIAVSSDLGRAVPGLTIGAGVWAPNAYPTRSLGADYQIDDPLNPPPPTRYDVVDQEAAVILPTIAAAYRITDQIDVGARFSWGIADVKAKVYLWGIPQNFEEWAGNESIFAFEGKDNFVPNYALGVRYRPLRNVELGGVYSSQLDVHAKGWGYPTPSQYLAIGGIPIQILPLSADVEDPERCSTEEGEVDPVVKLHTCSNFALPMLAKIGGRYIFRDPQGGERGDIEFDIDWENWGGASDYEVVTDGEASNIQLKHSFIRHGFKDTFSFRLGGGYGFPVGSGQLIARGGVAYDTAAAKSGWERLDIDGAARFMMAAGASYKLSRWQFDLGGGAVLEGFRRTRDKDELCNPTIARRGCDGSGNEAMTDDRTGPDPVNPAVELRNQNENPVNQGTYKSHYLLFTLGVSTWF